MDNYSKLFIQYVIIISIGVTVVGGLTSFYFCNGFSKSLVCISPTFEIILGSIIGAATTALFFWLIEKRQGDLEDAQNYGFMNIVYPVYVGAFYVGWNLSMMYYASNPNDQWNQIKKICPIFGISTTNRDFHDEKEFNFFLNYSCQPDILIDLNPSLSQELYKIKDLARTEKHECLVDFQIKIKNEIIEMRSEFIKDFRIKHGYSVGDMIYAGWFTNKLIAQAQGYDFKITDFVINKFLNALHGFHSGPKILNYFKKSFVLWKANKLSFEQADAFITLVSLYITFTGSNLKIYSDLIKFLSSNTLPNNKDFEKKSKHFLENFPPNTFLDYHEKEEDASDHTEDWMYKLEKENNDFIFESKVPGPEDNIRCYLSKGYLYLEGSHSWSRKILIDKEQPILKILDRKYKNGILILQIKIDHVGLSIDKGNRFSLDKQFDDAITCYDKALEIDPKNVNALTGKANAFAWLEQHNDAIEYFDKALEIDPKNTYALTGKADAFSWLEQHNDAIVWYDKTLEIDPKNVVALINKGFALHHLEKYSDAIVCYDKTLEIDPKNTYALTGKADAFAWLEQYNDAIEYFDKVLEIDPKNVNALTGKANAFSWLEQHYDAIEYFDKVLEIDPKNVNALTGKGIVLARIGKNVTAMIHCDKALEIEPNSDFIIYRKARILSLLSKTSDAIECLKKAIILNSENKNLAKSENDFNNISHEKSFKELLN